MGGETVIQSLHEAMTKDLLRDMGGESQRDPAMGHGLFFGGLDAVGRHWLGFRRRQWAVQHEATPAVCQASLWLQDLERFGPPPTARDVARQLARLCGEDSSVVIPDRKLADAVGVANRAGQVVAYMQRGRKWLIDEGWLTREIEGKGRACRTTYALMPGPLRNPDRLMFDRLSSDVVAEQARERLAQRLALYEPVTPKN